MPLTDSALRNAKPTDKTQRLFDGEGLYLEVSPSGGKWWRLKYRMPGVDPKTGAHKLTEKRLSLGTYPDVGLKDARERKTEARALLAAGIDPGEARKESKVAARLAQLNTFEAVAGAWLAKCAPDWDVGTLRKVRASLETYAFPAIGQTPLAEVRPIDVRELVKGIDAAGNRETAGRVFQRVKAVYRYAIQEELTDNDPTHALKPSEFLRKQTVTHRASLAERDVPGFLYRLEQYEGNQVTKTALALLLLTAVRPGELRGAKWEEFDEARALWRIPADRMKMGTEHTVPLSAQALRILEELRPLTGGGPLVFPSPFYPRQPFSDGTLNSALAYMGYKGKATAHGFRTLFSTSANEAGWPTDGYPSDSSSCNGGLTTLTSCARAAT
jgi:integrase